MKRRESGHLMRILIVSVSLACSGAASAKNVPDLEYNAQNGDTESVDSVASDVAASSGRVAGSAFGALSAPVGSDHNIRHVVDHGYGRGRDVTTLTSGPEDDLSPRIAIKGDGSATVVWWRDEDVDEILYVTRTGGAWSPERRISNDGEDSRNPEVGVQGSTTWVAYETHSYLSTLITVVGITDGPEPFPSGRTALGFTFLTGDVDVRVHTESGQAWVTWIDSPTAVGWAAYDVTSDKWGPTNYEPYLTDDVEAARSRIRDRVVGAP